MKVYVVSEIDYDWTPTIGVFLNKENAVSCVEELFEDLCKTGEWKRSKGWDYYWDIEEVEVDDV